MISPEAETIAYLAPEIPALSATFVYEEILGLESRGFRIQPFSVRHPTSLAAGQKALAERTIYLYAPGFWSNLIFGMLSLPASDGGTWRALKWLGADILEFGVFKTAGWKLVYQFLVAAILARHLKRLKCGHLHVHFAHVPAQIAMYASAMSGVPFTVMAHANDIFERGMLLTRKAERARKFLTISEFNRVYLEESGLPLDKLAVVRCGVSFEMMGRSTRLADKPTFRIGTLGRLVEKKGVDVLIRAIAALRERSYSIELSIAGDGPLRPELEQLVDDLGLSGIVVFVGSLSHHEVAEWMRGLDVFVLACKKDANGDMDGIPVVLMEAMSQSVPVVSTRLSGIPELVIHQQTGLLAEPANTTDLARQINEMLCTDGYAEQLGRNAQLHVQKEFGRDVNLDRLLGYFHT